MGVLRHRDMANCTFLAGWAATPGTPHIEPIQNHHSSPIGSGRGSPGRVRAVGQEHSQADENFRLWEKIFKVATAANLPTLVNPAETDQ